MLAHAALLCATHPKPQRLTTQALTHTPNYYPHPCDSPCTSSTAPPPSTKDTARTGSSNFNKPAPNSATTPSGAEQAASAATLEFHAALLLGHTTAARTVHGWLAEPTHHHDPTNAELLLMRAWTESTTGRHDHARTILRPILAATTPALLPHTLVDAWLLETTLAVTADERPTARRALQSALTLAEPLAALRPFIHAGPHVRELLVHQLGSFGTTDTFAHQALAAGNTHHHHHTTLSQRELTVLGLLPSMLSLDEIATDLTVSVIPSKATSAPSTPNSASAAAALPRGPMPREREAAGDAADSGVQDRGTCTPRSVRAAARAVGGVGR